MSGKVVLEVGPGTGVLSAALLNRGVHLLAVEIDAELAPLLTDVTRPFNDRCTLLFGDVLASKHRLAEPVADALRGMGVEGAMPPFQLVANLPYTIATPLIVNLVIDWPTMAGAVVMVQREMADRLDATVGTADYGPVSVIVQATCHVTRVGEVPAACFWPVPKVDSTIVQLTRREIPRTTNPTRLAAVARHLFAQRRKQLGSIVRRQFPGQSLPDIVDSAARPQDLTVDQVVALAKALEPPPT